MEKLKKIVESTMNDLLKSGADFGYVLANEHEKHEFNVEGDRFTLLRTTFNNSMSLCAYVDKKKGSISINSFNEDVVKEAVSDCLSFAKEGKEDDAYAIYEKQPQESFREGVEKPDTDLFFKRLSEFMDTLKKDYPQILIYAVIASYDKSSTAYCNSNETKFDSINQSYTVVVEYSAKEGDQVTSLTGSGVDTIDLETPIIEQGSIKKDLEDCIAQLNVKPLSGKLEDPVVIFKPGCLGEMMMYFAGTFIGEGSILEKTCPWYDMIGKKVCDERITLSNKPYDERIVCGDRFVWDGKKTADYDIIKDGVLMNFPISLYTANKSGFKPAPTDGRSTVVKNGEKSIDEIIKETKCGILVGGYSGGHPASNGDFSGVAKSSFLIEDGKIVCALSEAMISGNFKDMLNNVVDISKEYVTDGASVLPYFACKSIVVAGK